MACIPTPQVPVPTLPSPLSVEFALPPASFAPELCCKILAFGVTPPPIGIGIPLNPAIQAAITETLRTVQDYLDSLPPECPRE